MQEEFNYWALLTPSWEKFQVLKVRLGMERIQGLSGKEKAIYGLVLVFCKFWV